MGVGRRQSEITFPISSNIVLWANWRADIKNGYSETNNQIVREINRRTATNITRFCYFSADEAWIQKFINKEGHKLNFIR